MTRSPPSWWNAAKATTDSKHNLPVAENVLDHVAADRRLEARGVKQAGFVVLKSVEFPSILVETRLLKSPDFQRQIAKQIAEGVRHYFGRTGVELRGAGAESSGAGD